MNDQLAQEEEECGEPCHPDSECVHCAPYWRRMMDEGYWDADQGRWTDKGWQEIVK